MKLENLSIGKEGIYEINILQNNNKYIVRASSDKLEILGRGAFEKGGEYDKANKETTWYLRHSCGAAGFGQGLDDYCSCCENNSKTTDRIIGRINGNSELEEIISYSLKVEYEFKEIFGNLSDSLQ